jgi:hypothetical protein
VCSQVRHGVETPDKYSISVGRRLRGTVVTEKASQLMSVSPCLNHAMWLSKFCGEWFIFFTPLLS